MGGGLYLIIFKAIFFPVFSDEIKSPRKENDKNSRSD